jgi:electron-transferring-flavoprotein dehydrogenase
MADLPPRESMDFDVVVVGAGPAGLSTAIRLKQVAAESGADVSVVVVEKGSEVGAHILSGAVVDPIGLDRLLPEWREDPDRPLRTQVTRDEFMYLGHAGGVRLPNVFMPRLMDNHGNFVGSLGNVARYLGRKAEELGVEIYPGFPAAEVLIEDGKVVGIATGDMGIGRNGEPNANYTRGMELKAKYTVFAEGARGNLTKQMIDRYGLDSGRDHQKYGIGIKELWEIRPENHRPGLVQHSMGWPLPNHAGGGSWLYHFDENLVSVGFVVHLTTPTRPCPPSTSFSASRRIP